MYLQEESEAPRGLLDENRGSMHLEILACFFGLEGRRTGMVCDWLTSLRMAHTAESLRTESRRAMMGLNEGSTAPSATPFSN